MKKKNKDELNDELRPEYDLPKLKGGIRGKYAKRFKEGNNLVLLSPEIAQFFPNDEAVNAALKSLVDIAKVQFPQNR